MTSLKENKIKPVIGEVKKGEVYHYWIRKHETVSTEIKKKERLGVIISTNKLNKWDKHFIIVPLTSRKVNSQYHYEVPTFVDNQSGKALIDQIKTVDKKGYWRK